MTKTYGPVQTEPDHIDIFINNQKEFKKKDRNGGFVIETDILKTIVVQSHVAGRKDIW